MPGKHESNTSEYRTRRGLAPADIRRRCRSTKEGCFTVDGFRDAVFQVLCLRTASFDVSGCNNAKKLIYAVRNKQVTGSIRSRPPAGRPLDQPFRIGWVASRSQPCCLPGGMSPKLAFFARLD